MSLSQFTLRPRVRRFFALLILLALVAISVGGPAAVFAQRPDGAPLLRQYDDPAVTPTDKGPSVIEPAAPILDAPAPDAPVLTARGRGEIIRDQFIVVLKDNIGNGAEARQAVDALVKANGGRVLQSYSAALNGLAVTLNAQALRAVQAHPAVAYIEPDQIVTIADQQTGATWGLDRIDQRDLPLNSIYTYNSYGTGVRAYIIDTGIRFSHQLFGGRAVTGYDAIDGGSADDCNGHGTHVAGTVGSSTYGVAKNVTLIGVRVLNCSGSGSNSQVIAGIDWVTANHIKPAVANMSLGGSASTALDNAVVNSINAGVTYAVAAGNDNRNACNYSPARVGAAITVGSTTNTDARSSFSNYGNCLDIFAPGSNITSTWHTSDTATNTISGTSMASPHVAGVAALYLQSNPTASPTAVRDAIVNGATLNKVTNAGSGSPNRLLYSLLTGGGGPTPTPTNTPPPGGGNVIQNPGFESGPNVSWTDYASGGYEIIDTSRPRTGSYGAWEGGYNNAIDYLYQQVTVPSNGTLRYYWRMESQETTTTVVYDWMEVRLYNTSGTYLTTLRRWSNISAENVWTQDTISLAGYAGQTLRLYFYTDTDSSLPSSFFVDDVSLQ